MKCILKHNIPLNLASLSVLLMFLVFLAGSVPSFGSAVFSPSNPDITFNRARELAHNQLYSQARELCDEILKSYPDYHDAAILKGRTFAWEGDYDQAREILNEVRKKAPGNKDALYALIDVEI
ncbi:MAG: tetratricopeptide repeat protein, partial [Bacteroidales bacterium]